MSGLRNVPDRVAAALGDAAVSGHSVVGVNFTDRVAPVKNKGEHNSLTPKKYRGGRLERLLKRGKPLNQQEVQEYLINATSAAAGNETVRRRVSLFEKLTGGNG